MHAAGLGGPCLGPGGDQVGASLHGYFVELSLKYFQKLQDR